MVDRLEEALKQLELPEAAKYLISLPGHRYRARMALPGGINYAMAIELIHLSSLIYDDIMDNEKERKGNLAVHIKFSKGEALMAAVAMQAEAFRLISQDNSAITLLSNCIKKMVNGQNMENSIEANLNKTGCLFGIACSFSTQNNKLKAYTLGNEIGLLYQLLDDIKDKDGISLLYSQKFLERLKNNYIKDILKYENEFPEIIKIVKEEIL